MSSQYCYLCQKKINPVYHLVNRTIYACITDNLYFSLDKKSSKFKYNHKYYEASPYNQLQFFNNIYFQSKLNKLKALVNEKSPNILDVGCGWGNFLQVVKNNNISYLGIDLSSESIKICHEKKLNCEQVDLIKLSKNSRKKYSIISLFQVIEHIKNPLVYLKAAKKMLKKNGVLLLTTPNNDTPLRHLFGSNWSVYQTPSHYFFYSKLSLKRLLKQAGFNSFKVKIDQLRFFSSDYILRRIFKNNLSISQIINIPIPTDPWGDLEALVIKKQ